MRGAYINTESDTVQVHPWDHRVGPGPKHFTHPRPKVVGPSPYSSNRFTFVEMASVNCKFLGLLSKLNAIQEAVARYPI